ncbi:hypothetical protein GO621_18600 [Mucilaginibacter sp. HMF7410]|uniref:DKNYY family protein n=2 Tax=Mucilaginibacter arboris TaxID=2682090 RepID=A0A7K1T1U8_9SPHI|nr:hypothetical protein [Mucilaginibacter arboris]
MIFRQILISVIAFTLFASCRKGYKIQNNKVYYEYWNEASGQNQDVIKNADAESFQKLSFDCDCDFEFGKDKNHLYIDGIPIRKIDPNTFRFIGNYVFRDKDSSYFFGFYNDINNCSIKGVNPSKLKLISYPWSKEGKILIHGYDTLFLDDINTFVPIDENWGKTNQYVIYKSKKLNGADPNTFKIISSYAGSDKKHVYEFGKIKK